MKNLLLFLFLIPILVQAQMKPEWGGMGTAFAISSDGYFATNNHVIESQEFKTNAEVILVRVQIKEQVYVLNMKIVAQDKEHDLAILKAVNYVDLGTLPYYFSAEEIDIAEEVYALGYPRVELQGLEVKFTNGKISAKSGFQGDPSCYSANLNIDHGNSGGPVIDDKGKVIGVATSGVVTENSTSNYIVKTKHLLNLAKTVSGLQLPTKAVEVEKELSKQVKKVKNYVYMAVVFSSAEMFEETFEMPYDENVDITPPTLVPSKKVMEETPPQPPVEETVVTTPNNVATWTTPLILPEFDLMDVKKGDNWKQELLEVFANENINVIVKSKSGMELDRFTITDYITRLNLLKSYKVEVLNTDINDAGKVERLEVNEKRLR